MTWTAGPAATAEPIGEGVRAVVYPGPVETGDPWSQWGQGLVLPDGRFISATGDHLGPDGNSYLYEFDPESGELTLVTDVLSLTDHEAGTCGYGKIHAPLVAGPCGEIYAATYWGTRRDLTYDGGYEGDLLLRLDPAARTTRVVGVPAPGHGVPSMAASATTLVMQAPGPQSEPDAGTFVAYDLATGTSTVVDDTTDHVGFRAIAVDAEGRALFTKPAGRLTRFDPSTGELELLADALPGAFLRAATVPAPDGTVYGVTQNPARFLAIRADDTIDDLGPAPGYITSLALTPDGRTAYFVPGAHGDGWQQGTPVMALDTTSATMETVVELNPLTESAFGLTAGGTYNVALDAERDRLFVGLNAGPVATREDSTFGQVVLVEVDLAAHGRPDVVGSWGVPRDGATGPGHRLAGHHGLVGDRRRAHGNARPRRRLGRCRRGRLARLVRGHVRRPPARRLSGPRRDRAEPRPLAARHRRGRRHHLRRGGDGVHPESNERCRILRSGSRRRPRPRRRPQRQRRAGRPRPGGDRALAQRRRAPHAGGGEWPRPGFARALDRRGRPRRRRPSRSGRAGGPLARPAQPPLPQHRRPALRRDGARGGDGPDDVHGLGVGTGDLDQDGRTDVVVGGSNRVFLGTGRGVTEVPNAIAPWTLDGAEDDPAGVALGDVDGDGDLDIAIGQHFNSTIDDGAHAAVRLYLNDTVQPGALACAT